MTHAHPPSVPTRGFLLAAALLLAACAPARVASSTQGASNPAANASAADIEAAPADTFSLLTLNIWHNRGDWEARLPLLTREVRRLDPDVIVLQEVLQNDTLPNQAYTIARALGYEHVFMTSADPEDAPKRYGNAILARVPFDTTAQRLLEPLTDYRNAGYARLTLGTQPVRIYVTHLHHEMTPRGSGIRAMQMVDMLSFIEATDDGTPFLVAGDFNATSDGPEFRLLTPLRDLYAHFHPDALGAPTFGHYGGTLRRIDYVFDAGDALLVPVSTDIVLDQPGAPGLWPSDHFGVFTRFLLR